MMKNINLIFDAFFQNIVEKSLKIHSYSGSGGFYYPFNINFLNSNGYIQLDVGENLLKNQSLLCILSFILVVTFLLTYYLPSSLCFSS